MADDPIPDAPALEPEDFDHPEERWDSFFALAGLPQAYAAAVGAAIDFARGAEQDPRAERWTPLGPRNVGGAMRALAQDPRTPTTLYAGSALGGPWKTVDDGYSWQPIGGPDLLAPVGAIAVSSVDSMVVFAGTGEPDGKAPGRGFFRSINGGGSFERLASQTETNTGGAFRYTRIATDPMEARRCWAASDAGLWRFEPDGTGVQEFPPTGATFDIVTDVVLTRNPNNANEYILLAGVQGEGIRRGVYDRNKGETAWTRLTGGALPALGQVGRVRVAFSRSVGVARGSPWAYAIFEDRGMTQPAAPQQRYATIMLQSRDTGVNWAAAAGATSPAPCPAPAPGLVINPGQTFYTLVLEVDPSDPTRVLCGEVDLWVTTNAGVTWTQLARWLFYDNGDRAQHGDHHAILFDVRNPRQVWICNDGGISKTDDVRTLVPHPPTGPRAIPGNKPVWRKKSYSITCAEFVDLTTHPVFPYMVGGGMQDNGTFVSFGGQSWYRLAGGDGGAMGFDPNSAGHFYTTSQDGVDNVTLTAAPAPPPLPAVPPPPPEESTILPDLDPPLNLMIPTPVRLRFPTTVPPPPPPPAPPLPAAPTHPPTFVGLLAADPAVTDLFLVGRQLGAFYTTDAVNVGLLDTPGFSGDTSALAFGAGVAPRDMWVGTTTGQVFSLRGTAVPAVPPTPPAGTAPAAVTPPTWTRSLPAGAPTTAISSIAVHPQNGSVLAVTLWGGGAFLTHDAGLTWQSIRGSSHALPPGPTMSAAWDPDDTQVLFVGTVAGVYVTRGLPVLPVGHDVLPALDPEWRLYSLGLPLSPVTDLEIVPVAKTLRCATFGRGAFEVNIQGSTPAAFQIPDVRLSIREHPADDGRSYPAGHVLHSDPRLPPPGADPADFDHTHAIDIRVDAPSFARSEAFDFGNTIDGAEFDETLVCDHPLVGDTNYVYVQVQNRGSSPANSVQVFLYYADAGAAPGTAPPIAAELNYPGAPAPNSVWQPVEGSPQELGVLQPGQPVVVRFAWVPPLYITASVALLAVCSNGQDSLAAIPVGDPVAFVAGERRAALRVLTVNRDTVYIRDGVDDHGTGGGVAWGGRSPDIVVVQGAAPADPDTAFADTSDERLGDRARPGANLVYVRVFNRTEVPANANVQLFHLVQPANVLVPPANLNDATKDSWKPVGAPLAVNAIPPRGWKFAGPFAWNVPPDPDPGAPDAAKTVALLAMADTTDGAGLELDPFPDRTGITDIDSFWRFCLTAPLANNAALRALRFTTAAP